MLFYCVRHGETEFNAAGRIQGQADSLLSELGRRQCAAVARALREARLQIVYSSPLRRAVDSAECIAQELGLEVRVDSRLMEIHAGVFQGLTWPEIERLHPEAARSWKSRDPEFRIPDGESRAEVLARGREVFGELREAPYQRMLIVAHGGLLSAAFRGLLQIPPRLNPFTLDNGSISRLAWDDDVKLLSLNETAHLAELRTEGGDL